MEPREPAIGLVNADDVVVVVGVVGTHPNIYTLSTVRSIIQRIKILFKCTLLYLLPVTQRVLSSI